MRSVDEKAKVIKGGQIVNIKTRLEKLMSPKHGFMCNFKYLKGHLRLGYKGTDQEFYSESGVCVFVENSSLLAPQVWNLLQLSKRCQLRHDIYKEKGK